MRVRWFVLFLLGVMLILPTTAQEVETLTVYSGRSENLIAPLLEQFTADTGIQVDVVYASTAALANQIIEEGENSPADVYIAQDAGALGALAKAGRLATLPSDILERVENPAFQSPDGLWVGISGRARVLVYNTDMVGMEELPASILDLTGERWRGQIGWAPTNGSFQANVTAMRLLLGDEATAQWLESMVANETQPYENNTSVVQAVIDGEIAAGLVNHYYLYSFLAETPDLPAALHYFPGGDAGALVNVAGAAVINTSDHKGLSQRLILYLLGKGAQQYFAEQTYEYPLIAGAAPSVDVKPLAEIETPALDLSNLDDLAGTLSLIEASGALD